MKANTMVNEKTNKVWTVQEIREKITTDPKWMARAAVRLYSFQTEDEKFFGTTLHHNGKGFNCADAKVLTKIALDYTCTKRLTKEQIADGFERIGKYARQLTNIANSR